MNGTDLSDGFTILKEYKELKARDTYLEMDNLDAGNYLLYTEMEWVPNSST